MPQVKIVYEDLYQKMIDLPFLPHAGDENFIRLGESDKHNYGVLVDLDSYTFNLENGTVEMRTVVCKDAPWSSLPPTHDFFEKNGWTAFELE